MGLSLLFHNHLPRQCAKTNKNRGIHKTVDRLNVVSSSGAGVCHRRIKFGNILWAEEAILQVSLTNLIKMYTVALSVK